jgi:hypothetical protein
MMCDGGNERMTMNMLSTRRRCNTRPPTKTKARDSKQSLHKLYAGVNNSKGKVNNLDKPSVSVSGLALPRRNVIDPSRTTNVPIPASLCLRPLIQHFRATE